MRFRAGVIVGFAVGYVLGAKAGRERYEQIRATFDRLASSEPVQHFAENAMDLADDATAKLRDQMGEGLQDISKTIRDRLDGD